MKVEEAEQDSGKKEITKTEFRVLVSAFSKEMGMMETQLRCCWETACEALSLRKESESLKEQLSPKGYVTALTTSEEITDHNHILGDSSNGIYFEVLAKRGQRRGRPRRPPSPKPNRPDHMFLPPEAPLPPSPPTIKTPPPCKQA
ncbi:hypothetical protein FRX31_006557 [Thalictrum thalictroides]|uniref:Uncharacterized protein n=1 Tax=Thalictrum thalictroides TaxID=46969 RepID=A0A7J6X5J8_THATH|nr:hypothetical protein FRX31_006557 [Thalictrum thalictroides]